MLPPEYRQRAAVPTGADALLVIEAADTTLVYDRDVKIPLYARHGIPEAWLFDIQNTRTTLYRDPTPDGYRTVLSPARDATISPLLLPAITIQLSEVWPIDSGD